jgi:hypothetical protein
VFPKFLCCFLVGGPSTFLFLFFPNILKQLGHVVDSIFVSLLVFIESPLMFLPSSLLGLGPVQTPRDCHTNLYVEDPPLPHPN